nr:MAG TPA: hypothetical protein [Caudoviricetes sp.]
MGGGEVSHWFLLRFWGVLSHQFECREAHGP